MKFITPSVILLATLFVFSAPGLAQEKKKSKSPAEVRAKLLARLDKNGDGKIDKAERSAANKGRTPLRRFPGDDTKRKAKNSNSTNSKGKAGVSSKAKRPIDSSKRKTPESPIVTKGRPAPKPQGMSPKKK